MPALASTARLDQLTQPELADLIALSAPSASDTAMQKARIGIAANHIAHDPAVRAKLKMAQTLEDQLTIVDEAVRSELGGRSGLVAAGVMDYLANMRDQISESLSRTAGAPLAFLSTAAIDQIRPSLGDFVNRFLGDLLYYITQRGTPDAPGLIPKVLIDELAIAKTNQRNRGGEPIVLLTHSMGGQIAYDVITAFLPAAGSDIKVDFWCATASQVGFFEELNMFLSSKTAFSKATGQRTPLESAHLDHWWNVWDPNDILSYTTKGIFADGIDDQDYKSGLSLIAAHGGYLERPSFFSLFAEKLREAYPAGGG